MSRWDVVNGVALAAGVYCGWWLHRRVINPALHKIERRLWDRASRGRAPETSGEGR